ncbi:hypothetical protein [Streptomyces noursei]|uniref:hypothetical protein n=1 Tax=Streptomyces noursei TaxID=1971 RepID=UPI0030F340BD
MALPFYARLLLILVATLAAGVVGLVTVLLARGEGGRTPACIMRGSAAFGASLTLFVLVLTSLRALG